MKAHPFLLIAFGALAACQTYDFEPVPIFTATQYGSEVELEAKPLPPNIMLLLDKSGSMRALINPNKNVRDESIRDTDNLACNSTNCTTDVDTRECEPTCSTRINELRYAMKAFLDNSLEIAPEEDDFRPLGKFGLALFPEGTRCDLPDQIRFPLITSDDDAPLQERIKEIRDYIFNELYNIPRIGRTPINGGTPTAAALRHLQKNIPAFQKKEDNRKNFILLLTDGLPNCNQGHNECPDQRNHCICTNNNSSGICQPLGDSGVDKGCGNQPLNCLDRKTTVETIEELSAQGVETIVIGFSSEVTGGGLADNVLNAMARAGSDIRKCSQAPEPDKCQAYYSATDGDALRKVLQQISGELVQKPCEFKLSGKPAAPELLVVYVNGERIEPGKNTYYYNAEANRVDFYPEGEYCERLRASSYKNPMKVRIAVMQTF